MTVYVDELRPHPGSRLALFRAGACHLTADSVEELHAFAARIGMRRSWAQLPPKHRVPHYDLVASRREAALAAGAVFVPAKEQATKRIEARRNEPAAGQQREVNARTADGSPTDQDDRERPREGSNLRPSA